MIIIIILIIIIPIIIVIIIIIIIILDSHQGPIYNTIHRGFLSLNLNKNI